MQSDQPISLLSKMRIATRAFNAGQIERSELNAAIEAWERRNERTFVSDIAMRAYDEAICAGAE